MTSPYRALCDELKDAYAWCLEECMRVPAEEDTLIQRARAALAQPEPEGPTDEELIGPVMWMLDDHVYDNDRDEIAQSLRRLIARWGNSQAILDSSPQPVPVSERLPGPEDCDAEGRCWWEFEGSDDYEPCWTLGKMYGIAFDTTHWLPANALPTPEATND